MKMIRFKEDVPGDQGLVWRKGNIYKVLSEDDEQIIIESDAIDNEVYSIQRSDLNTYCLVYVCNGDINMNCQYCKYLCKYNNGEICENFKRSESSEPGLLQGFIPNYSPTV